MRWTPRALLPVAVGLFIVLSAAVAQAFPATTPDNTGMVDFPGAGGSSNAVAVRTIAQFGDNIWVGGRFTEIDDGNGNKVAGGDAANLAAFSATTGLFATGVHVPLVTSSVGDPEVYDSSVGPDGNLYFAGNFDAVDGQTRHNVAAVNATTGAADLVRTERRQRQRGPGDGLGHLRGHRQAAVLPAERRAPRPATRRPSPSSTRASARTPRSRSSATSSCRAARWWRPVSATA